MGARRVSVDGLAVALAEDYRANVRVRAVTVRAVHKCEPCTLTCFQPAPTLAPAARRSPRPLRTAAAMRLSFEHAGYAS